MKSQLFFIVFLLFSRSYVSSQSSTVLESYVQEAFSGNLALQQQQTELKKAQEAIRQAKALYFPKITFDANYTVAGGGRRIDFPIGDLLNPVYSTLNQLTQSNNFPMLENQQIQFLPNNFHETKVSYAVPIYNTDLKYNKQIQEALYQSRAAQMEAYKNELRYAVTEAYLNFLKAAEAQKIWIKALETLQELLHFNESLVKNNVATREIVATAQYEIARAEYERLALQQGQRNAGCYLNFLMNRPLDTEIRIDSSIYSTAIAENFGEQIAATALQNGMKDRQELQALSAAQHAAGLNVRRNEKERLLPDFYLGGSLGFQGFGYTFSREQAYVLAQLGLSYTLTDGGMQKSKIQEARLDALKLSQQREAAQKQMELQLMLAQNDFVTAYNLFKSNAFAVQNAESIFKIVNNKYKAGQALLIEYTDAQNRLTQARLQRALSWSDVLLHAAKLKQASGAGQ